MDLLCVSMYMYICVGFTRVLPPHTYNVICIRIVCVCVCVCGGGGGVE